MLLPKGHPQRHKPPALLFWTLAFLAFVETPLNLYNINRHSHESTVWIVMVIGGAVLSYVGLGLLIWDRSAQRRLSGQDAAPT